MVWVETKCEDLDACTDGDETAARAIAHTETGFPLFAEENYGSAVGTWITARTFSYSDPSVEPYPIEEIPRQQSRTE